MKYKIIKKLNKKQKKELYKLYKKEWWTKKRKPKDIKKMLKHTDIILGIVDKDKKLIGFVRVLSDFTYKAEIYDLIIDKKYRDKKLGTLLIKKILNHKKLKSIEHFSLQCTNEMVKYYKKLGFTEKLGDLVYMRHLKTIKKHS